MNMTEKSDILPAGFHDVLPPLAAAESRMVAQLLGLFEQFGFWQVKPPMAEFEETLLGDSGAKLTRQTFRVMDAVSHRMMGLRADMTLQIARLATQRMGHYPRPLRLSYAGPVLRMVGEGLHKNRELMQAGCELIGEDSAAADAAIVIVALEALRKLGLEDISVDFSIADMASSVMEQFGTPDNIRDVLFDCIDKKDLAAMNQVKDRSVLLLTSLMQVGMGGGTVETALDVVKQVQMLSLPKVMQQQMMQLKETLERVHYANPKLRLTVDVLERRGFEYHRGVCFSFFVKGVNEELGRGGRYLLKATQESATGFTLALETLLRVVPKQTAAKRVYIPSTIRAAETVALRAEGHITVHGLCEVSDARAEAVRLGCGFVYEAGEVRSCS